MTRPISRRTLLAGGGALGLGVALGGLAGCSSSSGEETAGGASAGSRPRRSRKPNIIVVTADDMRYDELPGMPNVQRFLVDEGTSFTAARHNIALCSPARAGFLTGRLSKHHGVRSQRDPFRRDNDLEKTLPVWLQDAGYHTAIIGKYLTEIEGRSTPPGWDLRRQLADGNQQQYGYRVWDGSDLLAPEADQARYLRQEVVRFLDEAPEPFFLWFTPTANHSPYEAPPGHEDDVVPELEDHREGDTSDKPPWIRQLTPVGDETFASIREQQRTRMRELLGLDDAVGAVVGSLATAGRLDDTVIMFTSDNGLLLGEHDIPPFTKNMPYDECVRSPCIVRGGPFPTQVVERPVHLSVDLTATCVALAGADADLTLDGMSLTDVASDPAADDRQLLYDRDARDGFTFGAQGPPPGRGIFTRTHKLIRWEDEARTVELYDIGADPYEHTNLASDPAHADERQELEGALDRLLSS